MSGQATPNAHSGGQVQANPAVNPSAAMVGHPHYQLHSELVRMAMPTAMREEARRLAYVNSVCVLFLAIGLVGLKPPPIHVRTLPEPMEIVPVVYTPPEELPKVEPQIQEPTDAEPTDEPAEVDIPQLVTVVAANTPGVAFAVPVEGPVAIAQSPRFASPPPPRQVVEPPKIIRFNPQAESGGNFPHPTYPRAELLARKEGKLMLYVIVSTNGLPESVTIKDSSGVPGLDRHASQWVKNNWNWRPGGVRHFYVPIEFQIR